VEDKNRPGVGAALLVWESEKRERILVGKGHSSDAEEIYALAGGHVENGETLVQSALRESLEESGVSVNEPSLLTVYEFYNESKRRQFITVAFEGIWDGSTPKPEKGKRESWHWMSIAEAMDLPLFESDKVLLANVVSGTVYDSDVSRRVYGYKEN